MVTPPRSTPASRVAAAVKSAKAEPAGSKAPARRKRAAGTARSLADTTEADRVRHAAIAEAAYLMAQGRGFEPGHELDDWLRAEAAYEATLPKG